MKLSDFERKRRSDHMRRINEIARENKWREKGLMGSKGKRWSLSDETKRRQGLAAVLRWKTGVYDESPMGAGKTGVRDDLGQFFRSSWEADVARVLELQCVDWIYEGFRFQTSFGIYIPDFYIPKDDYFIEVKGFDTLVARNKRKETRRKHEVRIVVIGPRRFRTLMDGLRDIDTHPFHLENLEGNGILRV